MIIKQIIEEDFINYKKPSMYIAFPHCDFKCEKEFGGEKFCQNSEIANQPNIQIDADTLISRYLENTITESVVICGLEPFLDWDQLYDFVKRFRAKCEDDIVIFTGYNEDEIVNYVSELSKYPGIIIKFGRYIPNRKNVHDELLGVDLASDNQYAKYIGKLRISLNSDITKVNEVRKAIDANGGYCPCSIVKTEDTQCMCKNFKNQNTPGFCHCELYYKY